MFDAGAWSCSHLLKGGCDILKKECSPGSKGCVLYGKAKFALSDTASNEAYEKKRSKERDKSKK